MRLCRLSPLLAILALAACGGDDGGDEGDRTTSTSAPATAGPLRFEQVRDFTLAHLKGDAEVSGECRELEWDSAAARTREVRAAFTGATRTEVLTCDGVSYLVYLEYPDAASTQRGLAATRIPHLIAEQRIVVVPLVAVDDAPRRRYLDALKANCKCGEVVTPK